MTISVVTVDDEPLAREGVALHLQQEKDIEVIASCADGREAIRAIVQLQPDLVFLDVTMPGLSGFDVIDAIGVKQMPAVIFLTAHDNFAVRAFDVCALDYLLKPIDAQRFGDAITKVREYLRHKSPLQNNVQISQVATPDSQGRIVVKSHGHIQFINIADILWLEANGDYVDVHTPTKTYLLRETMQNMEQQLYVHGFQRVHRSAIVKLALVIELITAPSGDYYVQLSSGNKVKLSRHYRDALVRRLAVS
jgi:two-component system, LytTR family, response regulator